WFAVGSEKERESPIVAMSKNGATPPHLVSLGIPTRLSEIVLRLIEKDPDRRYQSALELAADLAIAGMSVLPELSLNLRTESARREQTLLDLHSAYDELQAQEVTLREQQEELITTRAEIETERRRYQELFALAPDGYLVTDLHGVIREANQAAA